MLGFPLIKINSLPNITMIIYIILNTIYENIEIIANNVPDVNKPSIVFFKENTPTITFKQLNEIEKYIKDVYERLLEEKKLIKRLSFTLGNNSEIK